ncbi:hypothetical protein ED733_006567 [Metarhizium rileyi]|uniref:L-lactate dehydrogenase (cytochrome) n=1 Tax=Metarhizium rileyi (strain RCEF 4871) TaxID=1649241 RepID=A0A5C6GMA0_METRR|nr:hypothetical protein ED733_006567 [Metarhizium rileyi]
MTRRVSVSEISQHCSPRDSWIVVDGNVYDMTDFAPSHPGGPEIIHQYSGRDASVPYNKVHAPSLIKSSLDTKHHIGILDTATISETWKAENTPTAARPSREEVPSKPPLKDLISMYDFEAVARQSFSNKVWAYINGASNDNITRDINRAVLDKIWLRPAVMRDVGKVSAKTTLFGCHLEAPFYISPTGAARTAGEEGELALARGAGHSGIIHCISTPASYPHDEILEATPQHAFFQLYVDKDRAKSARLLRHISANTKVKAIFVTVDLPVVSKREDDERARPDSTVSKKQQPYHARDQKGAGLARQSGSFIDPTVTWHDIPWIRKNTSLPLVIKGIQRWQDAQKALDLECQGIIVSNHGGRAADTAQPSIITLLEMHRNCAHVFTSMTVLVDGGFRRGSDILKAICLGASAVGIGRPFLYAVNYGTSGVEHAVAVLRDEIGTAMRLCGMTNLMDDAGPDFLNVSPVEHLVHRGTHPYLRQIPRPKSRL